MPKKIKPEKIKEATLIGIWLCIVVKLFIFDFDIYLISQFAPRLKWVLDLKFFILLIILAIAWLALGHKTFFKSIGYIFVYPFRVLLWELPKLILKKWPLFIVLGPSIYIFIRRFRSIFVLYTLALVSSVITLLSQNPFWVFPAMAALIVFIVAHLYRSFRKVYSSGVFFTLARQTNRVRKFLLDVMVPRNLSEVAKTRPLSVNSTNVITLQHVYINHSITGLIVDKVDEVARGRKYDLYLVASLLYTITLTTVVYAFVYMGLFRVKPGAFENASGAGFWSFLSFSLNILTTSNVSKIQQSSSMSNFLCNTEVMCSVIISIIFVFLVLTVARETYREDIREFRMELMALSEGIEERIALACRMTVSQIENILLEQNVEMINFVRRLRGLPATQPTPIIEITNLQTEDEVLNCSDGKSGLIDAVVDKVELTQNFEDIGLNASIVEVAETTSEPQELYSVSGESNENMLNVSQ